MGTLRIGTRGSALALVQAELTELALRKISPDLELQRVIVTTTGDKRLDLQLAKLVDEKGNPLDKGVFTKELEQALEGNEIDVAVHSAKDVPTVLPEGMLLAGALPRAAVEDVLLVSGTQEIPLLSQLECGLRIATSSVRRAAIVRWRNPGLAVVEVRGNVQTRLRKLAAGESFDAMILARAGLERLGMDPASGKIELEGHVFSARILPLEEMLCAAGQGVVAFEVLAQEKKVQQILQQISHQPSWLSLRAERALLHALQAGCQTPVAAYAQVWGEEMQMQAYAFSEEELHLENCSPVAVSGVGSANMPEALGQKLGKELLQKLI